jgi:hypothetical protein
VYEEAEMYKLKTGRTLFLITKFFMLQKSEFSGQRSNILHTTEHSRRVIRTTLPLPPPPVMYLSSLHNTFATRARDSGQSFTKCTRAGSGNSTEHVPALQVQSITIAGAQRQNYFSLHSRL